MKYRPWVRIPPAPFWKSWGVWFSPSDSKSDSPRGLGGSNPPSSALGKLRDAGKVLKNRIAERVAERYKNSDVHAGTFWHGTGIDNLEDILQEGLVPGGGQGWGPAGPYDQINELYLTGDFGRAARYSMKFDHPTVIKIRISKPERLRRLQTDYRDKMLQPGGGHHVSPENDPLYDLRRKLDRYADKRNWYTDFDYSSSGVLPRFGGMDADYEEKVEGTNLYKRIKEDLNELYDPNRADNEYDAFLDKFRPGQYGEVHIRDNGVLRFDSSYWDRKHQLEYPDELPPAAVKEVWVLESSWNDLGVNPSETKETEVTRLAHEPEDIWEEMRSRAEELPEIIREDGLSAGEDEIERIYRMWEDDPGALQEAKEMFERYRDIMRESSSKEEAADEIEKKVDFLPLEPDPFFGTYDATFGKVKPGSV